jgi:hypothetical protein
MLAVIDQVSIEARFKGPPGSGHGGYSCALAAQFVDGTAEVTLRRPPPLERPLDVRREGDVVTLVDGDALVAEARPAELDLDVPEPPGFAEAERAAARSPLLESHPFGTCFVCGTEREPGDGLRLFAGPVRGREMFAVPWTPDASLADGNGAVRFEFVWSVLDCPSGNVVALMEARNPCVLARFAVRQAAPIRTGGSHVAIGWPISQERRKLHTGAAIFTADGELCAYARALWVELTDEQLRDVGTTSGA